MGYKWMIFIPLLMVYKWMIFIPLLPTVVVSSNAPPVRVVMGGNIILTNTACVGKGKWTVRKGVEDYRDVITCKETCSVEPRFQNRAQQRGSNLTISPVLFDDDGLYIFSCDDQETTWINLHLQPRTDTVVIAAGDNLSMSLFSLDQVKLNFTRKGSSVAETVCIVDNGKTFVSSQATFTVSVQNNTAVLSGVLEGGLVTGTDSKTGKKLFEVNVTVSGSVDQGSGSGEKCLPHKWGIIISSCINVLFLAIILVLGYLLKKKWQRSSSQQEEEIQKPARVEEYGLAEYHNQHNASLFHSESENDQESRTLEVSRVHTQNGQPEGHNETIL